MKFTDEQFEVAVKDSYSIAQVLKKLGLNSGRGGDYKSFHISNARLKLDTSHFTGQSWSKGRNFNSSKKIPLSTILVRHSTYQSSHQLKIRLIKEGMLEDKCKLCKITHWNNKKLSLHLDHINGMHYDNRIENLRLLCPNCHSQTETYCGKNISRLKGIEKKICECGQVISKKSKRCERCYHESEKGKQRNNFRKVKDRPSKEVLLSDVKEFGYLGTGRKYSVSDNSIRKWLK